MNKNMLIIGVILVLVLGIFAWYSMTSPTPAPTDQVVDERLVAPPEAEVIEEVPVSDEEPVPGDAVETVEIVYDGTKFTPATITVDQGTEVIFNNKSTKQMWVASADHPTHQKYPEFDAKAGVAADEVYSFKFDKIGEWGFHDHLNPTAFGRVTVE